MKYFSLKCLQHNGRESVFENSKVHVQMENMT